MILSHLIVYLHSLCSLYFEIFYLFFNLIPRVQELGLFSAESISKNLTMNFSQGESLISRMIEYLILFKEMKSCLINFTHKSSHFIVTMISQEYIVR